jgi:hypothetical protein
VRIDALGILLALAAAAFAAVEPRRPGERLVPFVGFAAAASIFGPQRFPGPDAVGVLIAGAAALGLARPAWRAAALGAAGISAGLWAGVLQIQGLPAAPALVLAALPAVAAGVLAVRRRGFAPPQLREESFVLVALFGLVVGLAPDLAEGWHSAARLAAAPRAASGGAWAPWIAIFATGCAAAGALYSLWRRR